MRIAWGGGFRRGGNWASPTGTDSWGPASSGPLVVSATASADWEGRTNPSLSQITDWESRFGLSLATTGDWESKPKRLTTTQLADYEGLGYFSALGKRQVADVAIGFIHGLVWEATSKRLFGCSFDYPPQFVRFNNPMEDLSSSDVITLSATTPVGTQALDLIYIPSKGKCYVVTVANSVIIHEIDPDTLSDTVVVNDAMSGYANVNAQSITTDGTYVYVVGEDFVGGYTYTQVIKYALSDWSRTATYSLSLGSGDANKLKGGHCIRYDSVSGKIFVTGNRKGNVYNPWIVRLATDGTIEDTHSFTDTTKAICDDFEFFGNNVWLPFEDNLSGQNVAHIQKDDFSVVTRLTTGVYQMCEGICVDSTYVYVTLFGGMGSYPTGSRNPGSILRIDPSDDSMTWFSPNVGYQSDEIRTDGYGNFYATSLVPSPGTGSRIMRTPIPWDVGVRAGCEGLRGLSTSETHSLLFDGASALERNVGVLDFNSPYTVTGWFRAVDTNTYRNLVGLADNSGANQDFLHLDGSGHLAIESEIASSFGGGGTGTTPYSINTWHFFALRRTSSSVLTLWLDDAHEITGATQDVSGRAATNLFRVGNRASGGTGFNGRLAQVRLWQSSLTDAELRAERDSSRIVKDGAFSDYRLGESAPTDPLGYDDRTGNGKNLYLVYGTDPVHAVGPLNGLSAVADWEALGHVAAAILADWESTSSEISVDQSVVGCWEAQAALRLSLQADWESRPPPVAVEQVGDWESEAGLSADRIGDWESLARLAVSGLTDWESMTPGAVFQAVTVCYESLGSLSAARFVDWEACAGILRGPPIAWESLADVLNATVGNWESGRVGISASGIADWESRPTYLSVVQVADWESRRSPFSAAAVADWESKFGLTLSRSGDWESRAKTSQPRTADYEARARITQSVLGDFESLTYVSTTPAGGVAASDDFNRTNSSSLGSNWTAITGRSTLTIVSSKAKPTSAVAGNFWSADSFSADHYSEVHKFVEGTADSSVASGIYSVAPAVRIQPGANSFYFAHLYPWDDGVDTGHSLQLGKVVAGVLTSLHVIDAAAFVIDVIIRIEVSGTTLTVKTGGTHGALTTRFTYTDASLSGGSPGIVSGFTPATGDDWYGGDLGGAGGAAPVIGWESRGLATKASASDWEARSRSAKTQTSDWESSGRVVSTTLGDYESKTNPSDVRSGNWESIKVVSVSLSGDWESRPSALTVTASADWESLEPFTSATASNAWESLFGLTGSIAVGWESGSPSGVVAQYASCSWESVRRLQTETAGDWESLAQHVTVASTADVEGLFGFSRAGSAGFESSTGQASAIAGTWESITRVALATASDWESSKGIAAPRSADWESVVVGLLASSSGNWESLVGAAKSAVAAWSSRAALAASRIATYESLTGNSITRAGAWESRRGTTATCIADWENIRVGLAAAQVADLESIITTSVSKSGNHEALLGARVASQTGGYEALGRIAEIAKSTWEAMSEALAIVGEQIAGWESLAARLSVGAADWESLAARVAAIRTGDHETRASAIASELAGYEASARIARGQLADVEASVGLIRAAIADYEAKRGLSPSKSGDWESIASIAKVVIESWESRTGLRLAGATAWESGRLPARSVSADWESNVSRSAARTGDHEGLLGARGEKAGGLESLGFIALRIRVTWESTGSAMAIVAEAVGDWESRAAPLSRSIVAPWESSIGVRTALQGTWESIQALHPTRIADWESIRTGLTKTATAAYEWHLGATLLQTAGYEALGHPTAAPKTDWESIAQPVRVIRVGYENLLPFTSADATGCYEWHLGVLAGQAAAWESIGLGLSSNQVAVGWESLLGFDPNYGIVWIEPPRSVAWIEPARSVLQVEPSRNTVAVEPYRGIGAAETRR